MEYFIMTFILLIQVFFYASCISVFLPVFPESELKKNARFMFRLMITLGSVTCFAFVWNNNAIDFFPADGFREYMTLTLGSLAFTWLFQIELFRTTKILRLVSACMLGTIFWLSLFTSIKLIAIAPLALFPLLGGMVAAPYMVALMSFYDIRQFSRKSGIQFAIISFSTSLLFLILVQLAMNTWTEENWALIKMFSWDYKLIELL